MRLIIRLFLWFLIPFVHACTKQRLPSDSNPATSSEDLVIDPATGIPYAMTFQHPLHGYGDSDYGFGFAQRNTRFCLEWSVARECLSYGYHLGRDTIPARTPVGTSVVAPADGIVRVTTDVQFGGYGSDRETISPYTGCVIVLEHLLKNGQAVTTLLGHLQCETAAYDAVTKKGNPKRGTVVRRGQYVGHIAHYWSGSPGQPVDWHHLHWGMRKGRFTAASYKREALAVFVSGYAKRSDFTVDPATGAFIHPTWLDPFLVVAANGDPLAQASAAVRFHPSGTLLQDLDGGMWLVKNGTEIGAVRSETFLVDRYDPEQLILVSDEELDCYHKTDDIVSQGHVTLYVRPGINTVVMAYDQSWERYDVIRWEALLSWGYDDSDLIPQAGAPFYESAYRHRGFRLLRPGTLVKGEEESEVAIITAQQTRLPIASGEVFELAGFRWERIISLPASVLEDVAGRRETRRLTIEDLHRCAVPPACPGGAISCGGGGLPGCSPGSMIACWCTSGLESEQVCAEDGMSFLDCQCPTIDPTDESDGGSIDGGAENPDDVQSSSKAIHLMFEAPVSGTTTLQGWWQTSDGATREWGTIPCPDPDPSDLYLACKLPVPPGALLFEFQLYLPDGRYWGDHACDSGGCNQPLGALTLTRATMSLTYTFTPNGNGPPYYNGRIAPVP